MLSQKIIVIYSYESKEIKVLISTLSLMVFFLLYVPIRSKQTCMPPNFKISVIVYETHANRAWGESMYTCFPLNIKRLFS